MPDQLEIMAPAGNFECLTAAIQGGANSVYFGVGQLNMRSHSANNFAMEDLQQVCDICRAAGIKSYLTVNITFYNEDLEAMQQLLVAAKKAGVTAVIASDMAAILEARRLGIEVHISTQLSISNIESLRFYAQFADVIVLARELTLPQVKEIHEAIVREGIKGPGGELIRLELFCHGALCMAVSGKCYLSLHAHNASANRGSCYQVCRRSYVVTDRDDGNELEIDNKYIMSPKDLCTIEFMDRIIDAGVKVFKIEGRARSGEYVKTASRAYRDAADAVLAGTYNAGLGAELKARLATVFNRGFWDGYYLGAKMGQWSDVYGNKATRTKQYIGKITNWFEKLGVAEVQIETGEISVGDPVLITGPTTGVLEFNVPEIRVDLKSVQTARKGDLCSIPCATKLRRSDKIFLFRERDDIL
ncbi:MAG: U32 family peptidase [Bacteroidales bacterium]|nr:U32 family peptidase [Bacteroidales bacterium]